MKIQEINIYCQDEIGYYGIETMLNTEKIPFKRIHSLSEFQNGTLILYNPQELPPHFDQPDTHVIILGTMDENLTETLFGKGKWYVDEGRKTDIDFCDGFMDPKVLDILKQNDVSRIIPVPTNAQKSINVKNVQVWAHCNGHPDQAVIIQKNNVIWCLLDLSRILFDLFTQSYYKKSKLSFSQKIVSSKAVQILYYNIVPRFIRKILQIRYFGGLTRKLESSQDLFYTRFLIDPTAWMLIQTMKAMLKKSSIAPLFWLRKWPFPYESAVVLTHDIEATRFSYKKGLPALLKILKKHKVKSTINLVALAAKKYISKKTKENLQVHELGCHGKYHDSRKWFIRPGRLKKRLHDARNIIEEVMGRSITIFRSPRLQTPRRINESIEYADFQLDSSYIDTNRDCSIMFGGGVSFNYPYHPPIRFPTIRKAKFMEIPISAPACITSLFLGYSIEENIDLFRRKLKYIQDIHGVFNVLIHAGVFDNNDTQVRMKTLESVIKMINSDVFWMATLSEIAQWWRQRESVEIHLEDSMLVVKNHSNQRIRGLVVVMEDGNMCVETRLPEIPPQATHRQKMNQEVSTL